MSETKFILGDKWLYYKIYMGNNTCDKILIDVVKPLAESLVARKIIDKWFFIRYGDPENHLRLRFKMFDVSNNLSLIIKEVYEALYFWVQNDVIWKVQTDTYKRESVRYKFLPIEISEEIFFLDSLMVVNLLYTIRMIGDENIRWLISLKAIDDFLNCFQISNIQKLTLTEKLKISYGEEFDRDKNLNSILNKKYAEQKKNIFRYMNMDADNNEIEDEWQLKMILKSKSSMLKNFIMSSNLNEVNDSTYDFLASHIHMMINRMFKSKNRLHEMVCYDFLYRYYLTKEKRNN